MLPRIVIDTAEIPGGGTLKLIRRGDDWFITLGANALMGSRLSGSEEALAALSLDRLQTPSPRILIGGLGMGFTLRAALSGSARRRGWRWPSWCPAVVAWARGPMAALHGASLDDPRVEIRVADVFDLIAACARRLRCDPARCR
jgi:spermidine synthase